MSIGTEINNYSVTIYLGSDLHRRAEIWVKDDNKRNKGRIYFIESGNESVKDFVDRGGNPVIHLPYDMFRDVLDLIRNEKPLYFGEGFLSTSSEPIGESE